MAINVKEFQRLKDNVDKLKRDADKAEGALEQQLAKLKADTGCETIEAGQRLLKRLKSEADDAEEAYADELAKFKAKWPEVVG